MPMRCANQLLQPAVLCCLVSKPPQAIDTLCTHSPYSTCIRTRLLESTSHRPRNLPAPHMSCRWQPWSALQLNIEVCDVRLAALVCLGTWPALFNLLERRGRSPAHTFLDYSIANYIVAIIIALTLGQIGHSTPEHPNFATQVHQVRRTAFAGEVNIMCDRGRQASLMQCTTHIRLHKEFCQ